MLAGKPEVLHFYFSVTLFQWCLIYIFKNFGGQKTSHIHVFEAEIRNSSYERMAQDAVHIGYYNYVPEYVPD